MNSESTDRSSAEAPEVPRGPRAVFNDLKKARWSYLLFTSIALLLVGASRFFEDPVAVVSACLLSMAFSLMYTSGVCHLLPKYPDEVGIFLSSGSDRTKVIIMRMTRLKGLSKSFVAGELLVFVVVIATTIYDFQKGIVASYIGVVLFLLVNLLFIRARFPGSWDMRIIRKDLLDYRV